MGNVKEVDVDTETKEKSGEIGSEDLDYNPTDNEVFDDDDDEHILADVPVSNYDTVCTKECTNHPVFTEYYALLRQYAQELVNQNQNMHHC